MSANNCVPNFVFLFFLLSIGSFLFACYRSFGSDLMHIRSAYEMSLLQYTSTKTILIIELILLPLLAPIIYSDSFYSDLRTGIYKNVLTRTGFRSYLWAKEIVIFLATFLTIFIPLLINQLLCLITFPQTGYDNRFNLPPYDIGFQNYDSEAILDLLRLEHPMLYNLAFIILISLMAAAFAVFTYGVFLIIRKSRFIIFAGVFLFMTLFSLLLTSFGSYRWSFSHLLVPGNKGSLVLLGAWIFVLILCSLIALYLRRRRHDIGLEE
ncbi:hypothetical protein [Paenibacillus caui]|uniref:hypothetical protein n=1 Tax=Paenibacillus caui TaxID=2873927 RepID=UPI001CA9C4DA|nr:hypothetical protein [Paenibacillus caui]